MPDKISIMLQICWRLFGVPYRYGANSILEGGLDCSGLVCEVLRSVGFIGKEDYNAQMLFDRFKANPNKIGPGALLFFGKSEKEISHVAIAMNENLMFEAGGGDATTKTTADAVKKNAYVRVRPIANRIDLKAVRNLI